MSSIYGNKITLSLFGDGASSAVGAVIEGLPAGFALDTEKLKDVCEYKVVSGMHADKLSGTPMCVLFPAASQPKLADTVSKDVLRPGFGDLGEYKKSGGKMVLRNGHHNVEVAERALLFAGEVACQLLEERRVHVYAHILQLGEVSEQSFEEFARIEDCLPSLQKGELPVIDKRKEMLMKLAIAKAQGDADTLGGKIELQIAGLPAGAGAPIFAGLKSRLSEMIFSLPRVTALEFGKGTEAAAMNGSTFNDLPYMDTTCGMVVTKTNNSGGIEGNMSTGMPLSLRATFAPSPAIGKPQPTVHRNEQRAVTLPPFEAPNPCDMKEMCALTRAAAALTIIDVLS